MIDSKFIQERIMRLVAQKNVSDSKASKALGHNPGYIKDITSGRALPSMGEFLYLCEYLGVTPQEFFNEERQTTALQQEAIDSIYALSEEDLTLFLQLLRRLH